MKNKKIGFFINRYIEIFIFCIISLCLNTVLNKPYQMQRDIFFYLGVLFTMILIMHVRGLKMTNWKMWVYLVLAFAVCIVVFAIKDINIHNYGRDYFFFLCLRAGIWVLFVGSILDLFQHKPTHLKTYIRNPLFIIYFLMVVVLVFVNRSDSIPLLCPIFALLLSKLTDERVKGLISEFAIGFYISFIYIFTKSLILFPANLSHQRYQGIFLENSGAAMICGYAFICAVFFVYVWYLDKNRKLWKLIISIVSVVYAGVAVILVASRGAEVGIALTLLCLFILLNRKHSTRIVRIRLISIAIFVVLAITAVLILAYSYSKRIAVGELGIDDLSYTMSHIVDIFDIHNSHGYFGPDSNEFSIYSVINRIDAFSSHRLAIYAEYIKHIRFLPTEIETISVYENSATTSPHNLFIYAALRYGAIGGILVLVWFVAYLVISIKRLCSKYNTTNIFLLMWIVFAFVIVNVITVYWSFPILYVLLMLQYPVFITMIRRTQSK